MSSAGYIHKMILRLQEIVASPAFDNFSSHESCAFKIGGVSDGVSILVQPPILEVPELVYFFRSGELCCGALGNNKVYLDINGTCPYGSHSKKSSMLVEGPMMLVTLSVR